MQLELPLIAACAFLPEDLVFIFSFINMKKDFILFLFRSFHLILFCSCFLGHLAAWTKFRRCPSLPLGGGSSTLSSHFSLFFSNTFLANSFVRAFARLILVHFLSVCTVPFHWIRNPRRQRSQRLCAALSPPLLRTWDICLSLLALFCTRCYL